jgi:hypothetical protein
VHAPLITISSNERNTPLQKFLSYTIVLLFFLILVLSVRSAVMPNVSVISYRFEDGQTGSGANPLFVKSTGKNVDLRFTVDLPFGIPTTFYVKPDDCLEVLVVNKQTVDPQIASFCDYSILGRSLNLSSYLKRGTNLFEMHLKDTGGLTGIRITPSYTSNTFFLLLRFCIFGAITLYCLGAILLFVKEPPLRWLWTTVLGGALLRLIYFIATLPNVRGNDVASHIEYIKYVATYFRIPPASEGWEFHQAPLFYFLSAIWMKLGNALGLHNESILRLIQFQSVLFSILILVIGLWLSVLIFPKKESIPRLLFVGVLATFPSLIFQAGSINNNSLYLVFTFLILALLLRWWQNAEEMDWYLLTFTFSLAFITRISTLIFAPIVALALFLRRNIPLAEKIRLGVIAALIVLLLNGWLPVLRFVIENNPQNSITFGSQRMHSRLTQPTLASTFLIFNPLQILRTPYASPWKDETRRQYFWEYFFRTAFFGEFSFSNELKGISLVILSFALSLIPFFFFGLWRIFTQRSYEAFPLCLTFLFLIASHVFYRLYAPFSSNQDFRFSLPLLPIIVFMIIWGIRESTTILRALGFYLVIALASACSAFIFVLTTFTP